MKVERQAPDLAQKEQLPHRTPFQERAHERNFTRFLLKVTKPPSKWHTEVPVSQSPYCMTEILKHIPVPKILTSTPL
jgi:hypothetical protein